MKPTTEQIIDWGRTALNETGALIPTEWNMKLLEAICSAAYEAGRKDENEACAKVAEAVEVPDVIYGAHPDYLEGKRMAISQAAAAIRARREQ